MRDEFSRRKLLACISGALAFTALPKPPALTMIATASAPASQLRTPLFEELLVPVEEIAAAFDKAMTENAAFRRVLVDTLCGCYELGSCSEDVTG